MKRVLVVRYSQSGQLRRVMEAVAGPLAAQAGIELTVLDLEPVEPYPFPWPVFRFFDTFPETVYGDAPVLRPFGISIAARFDLVLLGYQAWFLSPSLPVTAFLKSPEAAAWLKDTPVATVVACRDMWLLAQEQIKAQLARLGARHVAHAAFTDEAGSIGSFLATPLWVMTGHPGPRLGGLIPRAGVLPEKIQAASRLGARIVERWQSGGALDETLWRGLDAVRVNMGLLASEKAVRRGFLVWGRLLRALGPQGAWARKPVLLLYMLWLLFAIIVVVPLALLLRMALRPFFGAYIRERERYYASPSGD